MVQDIAGRLQVVRDRLRAAEARFGRPPGSVALLAVTKTRPPRDVREAFAAGQRSFGESYVSEALEKMPGLEDLPLEWHFIGPVQSNKTRPIAERFAWVHSVDREKIARRLSDQRPVGLPPLEVCLEVNVSGEASKSGVAPADLETLARLVAGLPRLRLRGLMAVPAPEEDFERQRSGFRRLRELFNELRAGGLALDTLSMGMTADLEAAVAEGSTVVRVGTAIFGPR